MWDFGRLLDDRMSDPGLYQPGDSVAVLVLGARNTLAITAYKGDDIEREIKNFWTIDDLELMPPSEGVWIWQGRYVPIPAHEDSADATGTVPRGTFTKVQ